MCQSLKGAVILAAKQLRDPNFFKTAVLILEHSEETAMGLVINRPSNVTVAHALSEHFHLPETSDLIYVGGPVEPTALCILHNKPSFQHDENSLLPGVTIGNSAQMFEEIVQAACSGKSNVKYRIFSGYAGWGAGQLESEINRGDWLVHKVTSCQVFDADSYTIYDSLLADFSKHHTLFTIPADHLEWN